MKKIILMATAIMSLCISAHAQNVNIPDANFKAALVADLAINTNADAEIQLTEANTFVGPLLLNNLSITDFTGLEEFTSLTDLTIANNSIASVDVSSNTSIEYLTLTNNAMTSIDVSSNTALIELKLSNNDLTQIDVSNLTNLAILECDYNQLTTINLAGATALNYLNCPWNNLISIDLSDNINLTNLSCYRNSMTSLDVTNNVNLVVITASINPLGSVDVSNNTLLEEVELYDCSLISLSMANGNNTIITYFDASVNPNLTCIQVDDSLYSATNWTSIDITASFSESCSGSGAGVNELKSMEMNIYPNPTSDQISIDSEDAIETISIFNAFGSLVQLETTATFSVENLAIGVYQIVVKTDKGIIRSRFVKE